jgi:outer membrane receptor protein involved in Fe transport
MITKLIIAGLLCISCIFLSVGQTKTATISGSVKDKVSHSSIPYVNIILALAKDSTFITGTITNEEGRFTLSNIVPGNYYLEFSFVGYRSLKQPLYVGTLSAFLDLGGIELTEDARILNDVVVMAKQDAVVEELSKKTFTVADNISQSGGSALQAMQNLPGVTIDQNGKVLLRGSDKVTVLIDGKQTALTGFGNQSGLDNLPASAIEKIEIINNPSAKYDANGNAGIINIVYKKNKQEGFNGKVGLTTGIGALGIKRENFPDIPSQYQYNPKLNPSLSLNYRQKKVNVFLQGDLLTQKALNKNEFFERSYTDGEVIHQQFLENRTQTAFTLKSGVDFNFNDRNAFTFSALLNREAHIDRGSLPYFNYDFSELKRLWNYYEDEVNTAINASANYNHKFVQPGHQLNISLNYTFHREDENFSFVNKLPTSTSDDVTKLIADENVTDFNVDYVKPLKHGRLETGTKLRWRYIPTNMVFVPGNNSVLDLGAQGWANYNELISALYGNYLYEIRKLELEAGIRVEYVNLDYKVDPNHNTYSSNGYNYVQPFPNFRMAYTTGERNKISIFYNRRVDRPDEQDLRIFPKYDDPEILKTGNPALRPQFTQTFEIGDKASWASGYLYIAAYHRITQNLLTRIFTTPPNSKFINSISQNAGNGYNTGIELVLNQDVTKWVSFNINLTGYKNIISAFSIENVYPFNVPFSAAQQENYSGNAKINVAFHLANKLDIQITSIYLAPDVIPQGKIDSRYSVDFGLKKGIQSGKGELFLNASDIFNTMRIKKNILSDGVRIKSTDLYETQVVRIGYSYKF